MRGGGGLVRPLGYPRRVAYRSLTHVALRVNGLSEAERYYQRLFGLEVAFREAETPEGWRTLPQDAGWEEAEAAGISLSMCMLSRDGFRLALEEVSAVGDHGVLDHVGLLMDPADLETLRERAEVLRRAELEHYRSRLEGLDPRQRDAIEALTRGILAKLLHDPTVRLKDAAGSARGERLADALTELFDL